MISYHDDVSHPFLAYCEAQTQRLVEAHWPKIQAVATALMEQKSLNVRQIRDIINSIPRDVIEAHQKRLAGSFEQEQRNSSQSTKKQHPDELP